MRAFGVVHSGLKAFGVVQGGLKAFGVVHSGLKAFGVVQGGLKAFGVVQGWLKAFGVVHSGLKALEVVHSWLKAFGVVQGGLKAFGVVHRSLWGGPGCVQGSNCFCGPHWTRASSCSWAGPCVNQLVQVPMGKAATAAEGLQHRLKEPLYSALLLLLLLWGDI